jgi:hypothetical protein
VVPDGEEPWEFRKLAYADGTGPAASLDWDLDWVPAAKPKADPGF